MITNMQVKPLGDDSTYREGRVYCKPWDTEIDVSLYEEDVTLEYAEKCAEAMNSMPQELIDTICRAAKLFCLEFFDAISDEWRAELSHAVPVDKDTPPAEMMKHFRPYALVVEPPADPSRIGYQLACNCAWEEEHGMEIDVLDGKLVYLCEYGGESPWDNHTDEEWNYALRVQ